MEEKELRRLAADHLNMKFQNCELIVPFFDFHALGLTLTSYLKKKYFGEDLRKLPFLEELEIRPDILGIMVLTTIDKWAYVIGEVKSRRVTMSDFRQCMNYVNLSHPIDGYLFYCEQMTQEVKRNILADNHKFLGLNSWGKLVLKRVHLSSFKRGRFTNGRIDLR